MYIFSFVRNFFAVDLPFLQVNSEISSKKAQTPGLSHGFALFRVNICSVAE